MNIVSFNINGIRARQHQLKAIVENHRPDIIGLQETKVQDAEFPVEAIEELGYQVWFHGQKGHYGVALMSRLDAAFVEKGYPFDSADAQRRLICGHFNLQGGERLYVINGYFPQGESRAHETKFPAKEKFYQDLQRYLEENFSSGDKLVVMGDFNIAPEDKDIGIGEDNAKRWLKQGKCSFLPEEREWFQRLAGWGLNDTFRSLHPENDEMFSWFDYRSRGFEREPKRGLRIDGILATESLSAHCCDAGIDYEIRSMEKPSDHCPVWAAFDL